MKRLLGKTAIGAAGLVTLLLVPMQACTDLNEVPSSSITPNNFFRNEAEVLAGLAGVYAQLRGTAPNASYYTMSEISTDEMVVPTRGQDWYDNGAWLEMHNMTWTASSIEGLGDINGVWNTAYAGIARANVFLSAVANVTVPDKDGIIAEARTLRAFYYYMLMDFFGGVPIVTTTEIAQRPRNTRREVFDFIESELIAARDSGLPATRSAADNGRITQGAADAILANMYINAGVFTKDNGINASAYNSCQGVTVSGGQDACDAAIAAADRLINSPNYQLAANFGDNFSPDNDQSPENIFVVKYIAQNALGNVWVMQGLHYNQFGPPTPWNGFATLAETYDAFDPADLRRQVILIGPQNNVLTGQPVNDRQGARLVFTDTIQDIRAATEGEGPRIYKYPADPNHVAENNGNDFVWFRLGEMYLIKAEALWAKGSPDATILNPLRTRAGLAPLGTIDAPTLLRERMFEMLGEGKRRQDLIRFGQYTGRVDPAYMAGGKQSADGHYVLMPIPQTQLDANPNLTQNPGY
jgi:hypothetical protein